MRLAAILLVSLICNLSFSQNRAPSCWLNYQDNFQGDIIINTLRVYPPSPTYTYYCALQWNAGGEGGGYCGMQEHPDGRNFVYSIWDPIGSNDPIKAVYQGAGTEIENFGGEGTGLKSWNFNLGWEPLQWYSFVSRVWDENNHSMFGFWIFDYANSKWHHLVTMDYPVQGVRFNTKTTSFIEDWLGNGENKREIHHKNGWKRKTGDLSWNPFTAAHFTRVSEAGASNYVDNYDGGVLEDFYFMKSGSVSVHPNSNSSESNLNLNNSNSDPGFAKVTIENFAMNTEGNNLKVSWNISDSKLPQYSYHFKIFDTPELTGTPVLSIDIIRPHIRNIDINISFLDIARTYYTRFYVVDIFDNQSNIQQGSFSKE